MKTLNALKKIVVGVSLVGLMYGCAQNKDKKVDTRIPKPSSNQTIVLHPDYLNGTMSSGYTLLSDLDSDGRWDVMERERIGFTTGDYQHELFYKKGFGPAQSPPEHVKVAFVDSTFFKPYE